MITIRNFINQMAEIKAKRMNISVEKSLQDGGISVIFFTNNGVRIFLDMANSENYGLNSRNVFRKISFEISKGDNENPRIPEELYKYGSFRTPEDIERYPYNGAIAYFDSVPERIMNQFLQMNGGINIEKAIEDFTQLWDRL